MRRNINDLLRVLELFIAKIPILDADHEKVSDDIDAGMRFSSNSFGIGIGISWNPNEQTTQSLVVLQLLDDSDGLQTITTDSKHETLTFTSNAKYPGKVYFVTMPSIFFTTQEEEFFQYSTVHDYALTLEEYKAMIEWSTANIPAGHRLSAWHGIDILNMNDVQYSSCINFIEGL